MESRRDTAPQPTPPFDADWAVFLDVDGTLLEFAQRPEQVVLRPDLPATLHALHTQIPTALISGRRLADLDRLFAPLVLPAAGQHGAERRAADGQIHRTEIAALVLAQIRAELAAWAHGLDGVVLEDKGLSLALHYRRAPERAADIAAWMRHVALRLADHFVVVPGNMVFEIRPSGRDKGHAIAAFMHEAPFAGRRPVFIGDDISDEDGFATVQQLGGHTIKVGPGASRARWRLADVARVLAWLGDYTHWLRPEISHG